MELTVPIGKAILNTLVLWVFITVVILILSKILWKIGKLLQWKLQNPRISGSLIGLEDQIERVGSKDSSDAMLYYILATMRQLYKEGFDSDQEYEMFYRMQKKFQDRLDPLHSNTCYFIERNMDHEWLTINLEWTNNPLEALRSSTYIRAYEFGCSFLNPLSFKVTEHLFVNEN